MNFCTFWNINTGNSKSVVEHIWQLEKDRQDSFVLLQRAYESLAECTERLNNNSAQLEQDGLSEKDRTRIEKINVKFRSAIYTLTTKIQQLADSIDHVEKRLSELRVQAQLQQTLQAGNNGKYASLAPFGG